MTKQKRNSLIILFTILLSGCCCKMAEAQIAWDYNPPRGYVACKVQQPLVIDGIPEKAWDNAPWSEPFNDIEGVKKPKPRFQTRMKMLWDDHYLYVYAEMEEPHVWAYEKRRDATIFLENDFEMFIKPSTLTPTYGEFEMNALGTVWDLFFMRPYRSGANYMDSWDMREMLASVHINGTINNPKDTDKGWNVELAFPWNALKELGRKSPVQDGDIWRFNFSRVEWQHTVTPEGKYIRKQGSKGETLKEDNWTWTPMRVIQLHEPEYWGYLQLSDKTNSPSELKRPKEEPVLQALFYLFRAKKDKMEAKSIKELIGNDTIIVKGITMKAELQPSLFGFYILITNTGTGEKYAIDDKEVVTKM
ncbi:MAG: carbohydrate-binding family 9-like protein [Mariniphaga sp.]